MTKVYIYLYPTLDDAILRLLRIEDNLKEYLEDSNTSLDTLVSITKSGRFEVRISIIPNQ